jgi:hypothetical protein
MKPPMSEQREAWSPPRDWHGDIEIEVRASGERQALTLSDATHGDLVGVRAALAEAASRHAYGKAARERAARARQSPRPKARGTTAVDLQDEPEPGHTGPSTGHS